MNKRRQSDIRKLIDKLNEGITQDVTTMIHSIIELEKRSLEKYRKNGDKGATSRSEEALAHLVSVLVALDASDRAGAQEHLHKTLLATTITSGDVGEPVQAVAAAEPSDYLSEVDQPVKRELSMDDLDFEERKRASAEATRRKNLAKGWTAEALDAYNAGGDAYEAYCHNHPEHMDQV